jgi:hypothetical protein
MQTESLRLTFMTYSITLSLAQRFLVYGAPLILGVLSFTHPLAMTTRELAPQADWFITLHILQLVLFASEHTPYHRSRGTARDSQPPR